MDSLTAQNVTLTSVAENRLTAMSGGVTSSYVYDGDGNRVKETVAGVVRVFIGNYYEVAAGVVKKYYYAGAMRVAENSGGTLYYLLTDHPSTALRTGSRLHRSDDRQRRQPRDRAALVRSLSRAG